MYTYILLYRCKDETEYHNTCVSENIFQIQKHILLCGFQDDYDRLKLEMMILRSRKGFFMLKNCMILTQERSKKYGKDDKRTLRKT